VALGGVGSPGAREDVRERGGGGRGRKGWREGLGTLRWARQARERGGREGLGTLTAWKPRRLWRGTPTEVISAVTSAALSGSPSTYMYMYIRRGAVRRAEEGQGRETG
jgi:hypothetical protein